MKQLTREELLRVMGGDEDPTGDPVAEEDAKLRWNYHWVGAIPNP